MQHRNESNENPFEGFIIVEFDADAGIKCQRNFEFFREVAMVVWKFSDANGIEEPGTDENGVCQRNDCMF